MSFKNLIGMYKAAIIRCTEIMTTGEGDKNEASQYIDVLKIIEAVHIIMLYDGNISAVDVIGLNDEQKLVLGKLEVVLNSLEDIMKKIEGHDWKNFLDIL